MKIALPYLKKTTDYETFSLGDLNAVARDLLLASDQLPCYLEVSDDSQQCFLFFREKQIYAAGTVKDGSFQEMTIRDFLVTTGQMTSARAAAYEVNSKVLHSLLILFQKKPTLKLLTSMVDLDEVLDRIEEEGKSCIVSASQNEFLAALRYEKGEVTALCHEQSHTSPQEPTFREDFLVKIYTLSAETPLSINIYEDLLVKYAADAKNIEDGFSGDISEIYMTKPPVLTLEFKGKQVGHWVMDKPTMNIGRTADNDIVIDNLAVSRLHAVLEKDKGHFYVRDCDSLNGTMLNGHKIGRARLQSGDEVVIGKHSLKFHQQSGMDLSAAPAAQGAFDQTVIMNSGKASPEPEMEVAVTEDDVESSGAPRLVEHTPSGDIVFTLDKPSCRIGKDASADVEIGGLFVADEHAEITLEDGGYVIRHLNGRRKVCVSGETIREKVLEDKDSITIGKRQFIFQQ